MKVRITLTLDAEATVSYLKLDGHALHEIVCQEVGDIVEKELSLNGIEVKNIVTSHSFAESLSRERP